MKIVRIVIEHTPFFRDGTVDKQFWLKLWRLHRSKSAETLLKTVEQLME